MPVFLLIKCEYQVEYPRVIWYLKQVFFFSPRHLG